MFHHFGFVSCHNFGSSSSCRRYLAGAVSLSRFVKCQISWVTSGRAILCFTLRILCSFYPSLASKVILSLLAVRASLMTFTVQVFYYYEHMPSPITKDWCWQFLELYMVALLSWTWCVLMSAFMVSMLDEYLLQVATILDGCDISDSQGRTILM
jgi:hypothetical protein